MSINSTQSVKITGDIYTTIGKIDKNLDKANVFLQKAMDGNAKAPGGFTTIGEFVSQLNECLQQSQKVVTKEKEYVDSYNKKVKHWDQAVEALKSGDKKTAIKKLNKLQKNGGKGLVDKILEDLGYKAVYKKNAKNVFVIASLKKKNKKKKEKTPPVSPPGNQKPEENTKAKVTKNTTSKVTTVASLKKALKKALKKGDASAVSAYTLLASAIGKKKAKAYANKLGYDVKYKDKKVVALNKIEEKAILSVGKDGNKDKDTTNANNTTTPDKNENDNKRPSTIINEGNNTNTNPSDNNNINNNPNNNQDNKNDVVASVDPVENDTNNKPAPPSNPTNDNNTTNNSSNNTNNTNNTNNSSSNHTRGETNSENNNSVNNTPEIKGEENASSTEGEGIDNDIPADLEEDSEEIPKKNKVTTIDTDTEVEETKKSSGLGAAVPLGLGTIATGAAAVAGVRYLKNRNDSDNYDDSDDYDEDSEYIDSAQYASDDDEYSGPAGSVYTDVSESSVDDLYTDNVKEDSYIDPEDFEEDDDDDFSNDKAFEEINSNFN